MTDLTSSLTGHASPDTGTWTRRSASTTTTSAPSTCSLGLVREGEGVAARVLELLKLVSDNEIAIKLYNH